MTAGNDSHTFSAASLAHEIEEGAGRRWGILPRRSPAPLFACSTIRLFACSPVRPSARPGPSQPARLHRA
jgi:hypothetical protein